MSKFTTTCPIYKYIVVGDSGIGKSSMALRYVDNAFEEYSMPTIGIEFFVKHIQTMDGNKVRLNIWDTAGQEKYKSITRSYYNLAMGTVLCFSLIDRKSFNSLKSHIKDVNNFCKESVQIILVGTFFDKVNDNSEFDNFRQVSREEAELFAKENNILYYHEVSCKTGQNIVDAFDSLNKLVTIKFYDDLIKERGKSGFVIEEIDTEDGKSRGYCCI